MKPIYLEPDEEITSVIDKITALSDHQVALVAPKNSSLFQSLINLKLLAKEAKGQGKEVVLISPGKVGQRLASQVGLKAYATLGAVGQNLTDAPPSAVVEPEASETLPDGIKVNRYQPPAVTGDEALPEIEPPPIANPAVVADEPALVEPESLEGPVVPVSDVVMAEEATIPDQPIEAEEPTIGPPIRVAEPSEPKELPPIVSRGFQTEREFKIPWRSLIITGVFLLVVFVVLAIFLPKATVTVTFPAQAKDQTLTLNAKTVDDSQELTVVGNLVTSDKDGTKAITATGKKDIGSKATGTITITNKYKDSSGAGKDQTFSAGTKATDTKSKLVFTLNSAVTVGKVTYNSSTGQPIYQSKDVAVTAAEPGEAYNISPSSFTINGALSDTTATSSSSFSGGLTKQVTVLSQDDVDKAMTDLKNQVTTQATDDIKAKANQQMLLDGASWSTIKTQSVDKAVGDQVDSATATYSIELSAITFDNSTALGKIKTNLSKDLTADQELIIPDAQPPVLAFKSLDEAKTTMTFTAAVTAYVVAKLDKSALTHAIAHRSVAKAKDILLSKYSATSSEVTLSPSWWIDRLPILPQAIRLEYGFNQTPPATP